MVVVIFCLLVSIVIVSARWVDNGSKSSQKVHVHEDIGNDGIHSRVKRAYGCTYMSSNNAECNMHCKLVEKCNWGQCEGWANHLCRCKNRDNSYC
ncbi:unnamed protein product, partial [Mesorhabditis belari]|uniref:Uncharacterized protein n=1 Tax=Mesorhabditis belari TaxID=2138241 RepID=A0AAF3FJS6_9BILA